MPRAVKFLMDADAQSRLSGKYPSYNKKRPLTYGEVIDATCRIFKFTTAEREALLQRRSATIVCTPESFVEWQIWRSNAGFCNRWHGMDVQFVDQPQFPARLTLVERL